MTGRSRRAICLTLVVALAAFSAHADENPRSWLDRMGYALEYLNYEGTLVHVQGVDASVMHVVHRVDDGVPTERITAMDEIGREIIRRADDVTCILPDKQAVMVEQRGGADQSASPLRQQFSGDLHFDDRFYRMAIASGGNLVGRETHIITVRPTDHFRYGYRLWLDNATAMPLKVQIVGDDGSVVEQLLFSDISLPDRIPESAVQPSVMIDSFTWRRSRPQKENAVEAPTGIGSNTWRVADLPPGFDLLAVRAQRVESGETPLDHLVYSDGVASVSVFIEAGVAVADQGEGASRMGAANAYVTTIDGHLVTAVGEVPVRTVEAIARSVRPAVSER